MSLRIAVAGNQWITRFLIDELCAAGLTPSVILNMDETWAPKISGYTDLADVAKNIGAELYRPVSYSLKKPEDQERLSKHPIDVLIVFGWQRLIPDWLLTHCSKGAFGVHGGPEKPPRCRGRAVFNWALIMGYTRFYMYIFQLTPDVDNGDICNLVEFDILPHDDVLTLYHKNCIVSTKMFIDTIRQVESGVLKKIPQSHDGATYAPGRKPEQGGIDWLLTAPQIEGFVRALAPPYPGAFTELSGERIFIQRAHEFDHHIGFDATPGTVVTTFPNGHFIVACGKGSLYVRDYKAAGKTPAKGDAFTLFSGERTPLPVL